MKDSLHTLVYAVVLAAVCALLLTAASVRLKDYQDANREAERVRSILKVLRVGFNEDAPAADVLALFRRNVRTDGEGDDAVHERIAPAEDGPAVAVPFAGRGRNAPIKGFLALGADRRTIRGIIFHQHEETPGLGGRIEEVGFRNRFLGKRIVGADGRCGIRITRPGQAAAVNEVDGITAATKTCRKVQTMLNAAIERIVREPAGDG